MFSLSIITIIVFLVVNNIGRRKLTFFCVFLILILSVESSTAQKPLVLEDIEKIYQIDSSCFLHLDSVKYPPIKFTAAASQNKLFFSNPDTEKPYWYTFKVNNPDSVFHEWLLVSYNYSIDEIDMLIYSDMSPFEKQFFRDTMSIYQRKIQHKQPVFTLNLKPGETKTIYLRIKNESPYQYVFAIFSEYKFYSHFFLEYLQFGLFYGLMLFVLLYSIMNFIFLKDKVILIYAFFIVFQTSYMLFRDGNGLFLLPDYSEYADLIKNICRTALSVFILLYTAYFIKLDKKGIIFKCILTFFPLRIAYTFITLKDSTLLTFNLELAVILFCTFLSIRAFYKGNSDAKYMSVGLFLLSISYLIYYLTLVGMSSLGPVSFFSLYYGMALESIFMTIALTERFKRVKLDNYRKEQMNKELENLVVKRTELISVQNKLLEEQTEELNLFLYSASHDLKGPLKTIDGLCNLAMMDDHVNHDQIYHLIKDKLKKLESNINDLNLVTRIKNAKSSEKNLDLEVLHTSIIETFNKLPGFSELEVNFFIDVKKKFQADAFTMRCIFYNIIENSFKYKDSTKKSFIKVQVEEFDKHLEITFKDNGQGISQDRLPFIFNMFYRANEGSKEDTGLGLYIVKLAVKKLRGQISAESTLGMGTTISISIPFSLMNNEQELTGNPLLH
jgi:signal transduction histidine kinase